MRRGFRLIGKSDDFNEDTLTVDEPLFTRDLSGMSLVLGPSEQTRKWFRIKHNTRTTLTVEQGSLATYLPPLSNWWQSQLKQRLKREPTVEERREESQNRKGVFLICDGTPRGTRNGHFAWSSTNQNFDTARAGDDIVDDADHWAICLRLHDNRFSDFTDDKATVDVTPRRCRHFRPNPGETIRWVNLDFADPDAPRRVAEGHVEAHEHGLVTVRGFAVGRKGWGNRLVLSRAR